MKTLFFILSLGSGIAWWKYTSIPPITIKSTDWIALKVVAIVQGKEISIDAATLFRTESTLVVPLSFSKYQLTATRNQNNISAPAVLRIAITEGDTLIGQSVYVDFDTRTIEGQEDPKK